jgi:hypothetical protein
MPISFALPSSSSPLAAEPPLVEAGPFSAAALAIPPDFNPEAHNRNFTDFAREFFREHKSGGRFSRQTVAIESLIRWQNTPIKEPLLKSLQQRLFRPAAEVFKSILTYTTIDSSSQKEKVTLISKVISLIQPEEELRDEVYMQLVKQTTGNPNLESLYHTWKVFLVIVSIFPSSQKCEECIKSHLVASSVNSDPRIVEIVQFTFIRYSARCCSGKMASGQFPTPVIEKMLDAHTGTKPEFGSSLYEHLWCQRKRYPVLPIPKMMHDIAYALLSRGAQTMEGIFRLPGSMKKVAELQNSASEGEAGLANAGIHDLGSLFKSWFGSLPEPIIHKDLVPQMITAHTERSFVAFANQLQQVPQLTLKYLVGFLKQMATSEKETKMGGPNLAMVFAPNIVDMSMTTEPMQVARLSETAKEFLHALILEWDVFDVYPLTPELLRDVGGRT